MGGWVSAGRWLAAASAGVLQARQPQCQPTPAPFDPPQPHPFLGSRSENFKGTEWVKVPKVLWDRSAASVLTMEYTPGVKINKGA